jgi:peroxiredoxin
MEVNILRKMAAGFLLFATTFTSPMASVADNPAQMDTSTFLVLQDFQGRFHQLNEYAGNDKWLVVMFWSSQCEVSQASVKQYERFFKKHRSTDATVLGISLDGIANKENAQAFIRDHSLSFSNLLGEPEAIASIFYNLTGVQLDGTPGFLVYAPSGELVAQQVGAIPIELLERFISH